MEDLERTIARKIRCARLEAGLTAQQLAELIHVSNGSVISRYESGIRSTTPSTLLSIAKATHKDLAWFFGDQLVKYDINELCFNKIKVIYAKLQDQERAQLLSYAAFLLHRRQMHKPLQSGYINTPSGSTDLSNDVMAVADITDSYDENINERNLQTEKKPGDEASN